MEVIMYRTEKQQREFEKNIKYADTLGKRYNGKFVAIYKQKIVGQSYILDDLWKKIKKYDKNRELFVSYIHRN